MLRRMRFWKGLRPGRHDDVLQDLHQELLLDCLEHGDEIASLSPRERHSRWFRLVERQHYQLRLRDARRKDEQAPVDLQPTRTTAWPDEVLDAGDRELAQRLQTHAVRLRNGRLNTERTADALGIHPREVREIWTRIASALGYDDQYVEFWRRRLVEALLGLASDVLRDRGQLRVHGEGDRSRPDPSSRLARIRQIKNRLSVRPLPPELRRVLAQFSVPLGVTVDPICATRAAHSLQPDSPAVHLWNFEAEVARDRLDAAMTAVRSARRTGASSIRTTLARARILEARGRERAAAALLRRALARHPSDDRLRLALRGLSGPPGGREVQAARTATSAAINSRSRRASPRGELHFGPDQKSTRR